MYASVPSPNMQLCVPVDVIQLEDTAIVLDSACMLFIHVSKLFMLGIKFHVFNRCRSGWNGDNCDTCSPRQGCCKSIDIIYSGKCLNSS